jgi:hypothetical protein
VSGFSACWLRGCNAIFGFIFSSFFYPKRQGKLQGLKTIQ